MDEVVDIREEIAAAGTLAELGEVAARFDGFTFRGLDDVMVFGDGDPAGDIVFVGDAPSGADTKAGKPLAGRAGVLFEQMARAAGIPLEKGYVTNLAYLRPPGNRPLAAEEISVCVPFVRRVIDLCGPRMIVCLGAPPARGLLGLDGALLGPRGYWDEGLRGLYDYETRDGAIPAYVTYHPGFLLREPAHKWLAFRDLRNVADVLGGRRIDADMVKAEDSLYAAAR